MWDRILSGTSFAELVLLRCTKIGHRANTTVQPSNVLKEEKTNA